MKNWVKNNTNIALDADSLLLYFFIYSEKKEKQIKPRDLTPFEGMEV